MEEELILEKFLNKNSLQDEREWCSQRGVSTFTMREILKNSENIKNRVKSNNMKIGNEVDPQN